MVPLLGAVGLGVAGQVALKQGVADYASTGPWRLLQDAAGTPWVWGGFAAYGASLLLWLWVLSRAPLSVAYPMVALGYVLVVLVSAWAFGEPVPPMRWLAVGIIAGGVILLTRTSVAA